MRSLRAALLLGAALGVLACDGGRDQDAAAYQEYYRALGTTLQAMEDDLAAIAGAAEGLAGEELSAHLLAYRDELQITADEIAAFESPAGVREAHTAIVVATRDIADVTEREASLALGEGALTAEDVAAQGLARAADWYAACHALQDRARALEIDADLRCVTAFG